MVLSKKSEVFKQKTISIEKSGAPQSVAEQNVAIKNLETGCIDYQPTPVFNRESLNAGDIVHGPNLVASALSTTIVESGWKATMLGEGQLLIEKTNEAVGLAEDQLAQSSKRPDPTQLEIFNKDDIQALQEGTV